MGLNTHSSLVLFTVLVSVDHLAEEALILQTEVKVGCWRSSVVLNVYSACTAYQQISEGLMRSLCPGVSAAQS